MTHRSGYSPRRARLFIWLLLLAAAIGWAPLSMAANCTASTGTMTMPDVTVTSTNMAVGTVLATSPPVTIVFTCSGLPVSTSRPADYTATIQAGGTLATLDSTNVPAGPGITFKTNLTGIALSVTAGPVQASSESGNVNDGPDSLAGYPVGSYTAPSGSSTGSQSGQITATYIGQLIVTGNTVSTGTVNAINPLIPFWWYISGGSQNSSSAKLSAVLALGSSKVKTGTCSVNLDSTYLTVTLPAVGTASLPAQGATTGKTPFNINLTCKSSTQKVQITMTASNPSTTVTGVILPTTGAGYAANVGVQLLDGTGTTAVNVRGTKQTGVQLPTAGGALALPYYAQYYRTGAAAVSAGLVSATVTFVISYQ